MEQSSARQSWVLALGRAALTRSVAAADYGTELVSADGGGRSRVPGRMRSGFGPITARLACHQRGQCAATSASLAPGPKWRAAMLHRLSPRRTTTCSSVSRPAPGNRTPARCAPEVTSPPSAAGSKGPTGGVDGTHPGAGSAVHKGSGSREVPSQPLTGDAARTSPRPASSLGSPGNGSDAAARLVGEGDPEEANRLTGGARLASTAVVLKFIAVSAADPCGVGGRAQAAAAVVTPVASSSATAGRVQRGVKASAAARPRRWAVVPGRKDEATATKPEVSARRAVTAAHPDALKAVSNSAVSASDSVLNTAMAKRDDHTVTPMASAAAPTAEAATTRRLSVEGSRSTAHTMAVSFICLGLPSVATVDRSAKAVKARREDVDDDWEVGRGLVASFDPRHPAQRSVDRKRLPLVRAYRADQASPSA